MGLLLTNEERLAIGPLRRCSNVKQRSSSLLAPPAFFPTTGLSLSLQLWMGNNLMLHGLCAKTDTSTVEHVSCTGVGPCTAGHWSLPNRLIPTTFVAIGFDCCRNLHLRREVCDYLATQFALLLAPGCLVDTRGG